MQYSQISGDIQGAVIELYRSVFSDSEGESEGVAIESLVKALLKDTPKDEIMGYVASDGGKLVGAILLTRMTFSKGGVGWLLSPVAVSSAEQGKGVGQALIRFGLSSLKDQGATLVVTYGDPAFYSKVGFQSLPESMIEAPYPLSQPVGWIYQTLNDEALTHSLGKAQCVKGFSNPALW